MADKRKRSLVMARWSVSAIFFSAGAIFANWVARIPDIQSQLNLSEAALGFALMGASVGVLTGLTITGSLIQRFGSRRITYLGGIGLCLSLALPIVAFNFWSLAAVLFFLGAFNGVTDIAMNAQGVAVERGYGQSIMSSFHAAWSIGTFAGALMGAQFLAMGIATSTHFPLVAAGFALFVLLAGTRLIDVPHNEERDEADSNTFQLPPRAVWPLGMIAFAAALGEGAISDWSGVYLRDIVRVDASQTAWGFAAFTAMMTVGRLLGDRIVEWRSATWLVRTGGALATAGLLLPLFFSSSLPLTLIGFGMAGIGLATSIPLAFSAAGRIPGVTPGRALAGVATIGYGAFLVGPSVIGIIADLFSLRVAFVLVLMTVATLMVSAGAMTPAETTTGAQPAAAGEAIG